MGTETEKKYLVNAAKWAAVKANNKHSIEQGYIVNAEEKTVRVRTYDDKGFITIKGEAIGITRPEYEYEIPPGDAREILKNFCKSTIKKIRHKVMYHNNLWEVDEFLGENKGLLLAEIELKNKDQQFDLPRWIGKEVSDDKRYYNSYLSNHPFASWNKFL